MFLNPDKNTYYVHFPQASGPDFVIPSPAGVTMFTLALLQSLPFSERNNHASRN